MQEEEKDLSEDLLRLKVNFGEVLEEKEEYAALVDFLSQLHLGIKEMFLFSKELQFLLQRKKIISGRDGSCNQIVKRQIPTTV